MAKDVSAWRKRLDDLKHKTNKKKEQLLSLQDKHKEYSLCVVNAVGAGVDMKTTLTAAPSDRLKTALIKL